MELEPQTTYSLAQAVFGLTAAVIAPTFGLIGFLMGRRSIAGLYRFVMPTLGVVTGLTMMGAVIFTLYPEYPSVGFPERYAPLFVLPAHLFGLGAVRLISPHRAEEKAKEDMEAERKVRNFVGTLCGALWLIATVVSLGLGLTVVMPPRLALPEDATRIEETLQGKRMVTDHDYALEADMPPETFHAYVGQLQLQQVGPAYYRSLNGDCGMTARYQGGRMRLESWCHSKNAR
jgi:hypothetical protein